MGIRLSEEDYMLYDDCLYGICITCHGVHDCCEPDARKYLCEQCGTKTVYGTSELLIMGELEID